MGARRQTVICVAALLATQATCRNGEKRAPLVTAEVSSGAPAVVIRAEGREIEFRVELARTPDEQQQGLMYRTQMATDAGMLFLFERPGPLSFWMRNTVIPLDMIFIRADHTILGIVENAEPRTDSPRRIDGDSQFVLEINGGLSAKLGLRAGMVVEMKNIPAR